MKHIKLLKRRIALFLCITLLVPVCGVGSVSALVDQRIPVIDDNEQVEKAAVYWNPGSVADNPSLATSSNAGIPADLATGSNAGKAPDVASASDATGILGLASASDTTGIFGRASASDAADGLTPETAVKNLNTAVRQAEKLSRQLGIDIHDAVIYAMNPMVIPPDLSYTVDGKGVSVVPWREKADDDKTIFIVEGGKLSLNHITIRQDDWLAAPENAVLVYMSSGVIQLGEQVESYGTFVLDYTQSAFEKKPVIELLIQFDFASYFWLDLRIPNDLKDDVNVINALYSDQITADEFKEVFPLINHSPEADWELLVTEQIQGGLRDADEAEKRMFAASETKKSLIVRRREENSISGKLWLDENTNGLEDDEGVITGYTVSLYRAEDLNTAIHNTKTSEDGTYLFTGMGSGSYVVGIVAETDEKNQYFLPQTGITEHNKFSLTEIDGVVKAYSESIIFTTEAGAAASNIDAGLYRMLNLSYYTIGTYVNMPLGGNKLVEADKKKLVVMEADGNPSSGYYKAYTADESGMRSALYDIYKENKVKADYIMYFGSDINLPNDIFANQTQATGTADVTFASLQGRLNILVMTGNEEDHFTVSPADTEPTNNRLISVSGTQDRFFGCHIILRHICHRFGNGAAVYMNGYVLTLGGDSWQKASTRYFGGSNTGSITPADGTAAIIVYSTGNGVSDFSGGMLKGTLQGDAAVEIHGTSDNYYNEINIRGGGWGTSAGMANVTGSVTNRINRLSTNYGGLGCFIGGVEYGTVEGTITNTISGKGRFFHQSFAYNDVTSSSCFIGGSLNGDIGSFDNKTVIENNVDTGSYSKGFAFYYGTNQKSGTVIGNVINVVRAGEFNKGSIFSFCGGAGSLAAIGGTWIYSFEVDTKTYKVSNVSQGLEAAEKAAKYKLYGNITNIIRSGCVTSADANLAYFRGAGWGYMKGNVYSEVGTEGVVYFGNYTKNYKIYEYSTSDTKNPEVLLGFDLAGGGGTNAAYSNDFCIQGNTTLVTRNVLARWTYGGNFGGVQVGDSLRIHCGGVVDTCEGTGYHNYIHVGNGRAEVRGGQVDWFLSGGGWHDRYHDGNVSVEVYDEPDIYINATMGGTYGEGADHYITGDSSIVVKGGNFTGKARYGPGQGFSAGPTNAGYILGNASVTIDLTDNKNGFSIGKNDNISGGRRIGSGTGYSYLGTDNNNTITLNILTGNTEADSRKDLLNDLTIYGDGSSVYPDNTKAGHIIINVNAPGDNIGNIYATNYSNLKNSILRRNVQINLVSAKTITGLSAGNSTDDITNAVAQASETIGRKAVINIGPQSEVPLLGERENDQTLDELPHRINISTNGITNFTEMNIKKRLLVADQGDILNGKKAAVANHGGKYDEFGKITLYAGDGQAGAGLGISDNARIIAGTTEIAGNGKVYIQSGGQADQFVVTDIIRNDPNNDYVLMWLKIGEVNPKTDLSTHLFGAETGWCVITINPDSSKAKTITPVNFKGFEMTTGKTFIGDSDIHFSDKYGYAVAIPGSVYEWNVNEGNGLVSHNVPEVSTAIPSAGEIIKAYGTVSAGVKTEKGWIAIPSEFITSPDEYPEFDFIPGYIKGFVKLVNINGSDQKISDSHSYITGPGDYGETLKWKFAGDDKYYSFNIEAKFDQKRTSDVTVSKLVVGDYADRTKEFEFTIQFKDVNGAALADGTQLSGSIITDSGAASPAILTLDSEGSAAFLLKHGQQITITNMPPGFVQIAESVVLNYRTSYKDSRTNVEIKESDTGLVRLEGENIEFGFTNTRDEVVVPAGVSIGNDSGMYLLILSLLMLVGMTSAARIHYRRKRRWQYE